MHEFNYDRLKGRIWDNEIVSYISLIKEFKVKQDLYCDLFPEQLETLVEIAKVQSTESSNEIEGIVTTNQRLNQLMEQKTTPRNRNEKEILGYRSVLDLIHESYPDIPISANVILQLHGMLYSYLPDSFGGEFKNSQNQIAEIDKDGSVKVRFTPLAPVETPIAVDSLCDAYVSEISKIEPLLLIPIFIHDFLCIHPFLDGNGRMSRILTTLLLYKSGYNIPKYISLEKSIANTKSEYYSALQQSSCGWHENSQDELPFIKYMLGIILHAYRDLDERVTLITNKKNAKELVKGAFSIRLGRLRKSDLIELCPSLSKSSIEKSLRELVEEGYISRNGSARATYYTLK